MAEEFIIPTFLQNNTTDDIYETMRSILPEDIDSSEGSHTWNLLMPTALTVASLYEYVLPQVVQLIFPEWSYGAYLDAHARTRGMTRKAATAAEGSVTVTGQAGTNIPAGTTFSTSSLNSDDPAMSYATLAAATIPVIGSITVEVECTEAGTAGNTGPGTIIFLSSDVVGITEVTNDAAVSGGTDEETDEALRERIVEYDTTMSDSYVGNATDYRRWAMSVPGVGTASVISPTNNSGIVTIVLIDSNGNPASEDLCTDVYNYIMSPSNEYSRLAPINANLSVVSPTVVTIAVSATVELIDGAELADVSAAFLAALETYMPEALADQEVKITRVGAILSSISGVNDFSTLRIGTVTGGTPTYGTINITLGSAELPSVSAANIVLTAGTV